MTTILNIYSDLRESIDLERILREVNTLEKKRNICIKHNINNKNN